MNKRQFKDEVERLIAIDLYEREHGTMLAAPTYEDAMRAAFNTYHSDAIFRARVRRLSGNIMAALDRAERGVTIEQEIAQDEKRQALLAITHAGD